MDDIQLAAATVICAAYWIERIPLHPVVFLRPFSGWNMGFHLAAVRAFDTLGFRTPVVNQVVSNELRVVFSHLDSLVRNGNLGVEAPRPERLTRGIASRLYLSDVVGTRSELLAEGHGRAAVSSEPFVVAAGAVYLAAELEDERRTLAEVAQEAWVSASSVQRWARKLRK